MRLALVMALALACTGCAGALLGPSGEAPEIYRIEVADAAGDAARLPLALGVVRPRAAVSLDTERIAVVQPDNRFDYFAGVRWSEPAPQMLQAVVVRVLQSEGRYEVVVAAPNRVPTDVLLDIELRRFEAVYAMGGAAPTVRVEFQATLVDPRQVRRLSSFVASSEVVAADNRRDAVVDAFQRATSEAVHALAAWLREVEPNPAR
jgi:cholesterol transport system auxiliary component